MSVLFCQEASFTMHKKWVDLKSSFLVAKQVQKQLQLRIEAQGKYLKKIIEEQQRLSGVLSDAPSAGVTANQLGDNCPESEIRNDPGTPPPTSESPVMDKPSKERAAAKSFSLDESFSSPQEPQTPESGCRINLFENMDADRSSKKQRLSPSGLPPQISNVCPPFEQPHSIFWSFFGPF